MKTVVIASGGEVGSSGDILIIVAVGILIIMIIQGVSYLRKWMKYRKNKNDIEE